MWSSLQSSQKMTPSIPDIERHIDRERLVERLASLVKIPSENPPGDEKEVAELAASYCEDLGLEVAVYEGEPGRPSVVARWGREDGPTLAFCSHLDVVPVGDLALWEHPPFAATTDGTRMHGRGSSDAKGPIAAALEAVAALKASGEELAGTLELELVSDEEAMGFKGTGYLIEQGIVSPDLVIVGEPTRLRIVRAQRGPCWCRIITRGKAAHGSAPERGVNAIRHMAEIVLRLEETLPDITHPVVGGPSISVGTIHGGEKVNVVPAQCVAEIDRRSIPGETEESVVGSIQAAIDLAKERFPDIDATIELPALGLPFETKEGSAVVQAMAAAVEEATGEPAELVGFRGSSDARFFAEAGAEVAICGPGDIAVAHTAHEYIELESLYRGALAYALAFVRLLSPQ
jgi:succinyl-diaminopimelate desuccinylase